MGNNPPEQDEVSRREQQAIIDALTPEEQHELKIIKENLEKRGTSEHALSYKLAWAEACGLITACSSSLSQGDKLIELAMKMAPYATGVEFVMPDGGTMTVPDPEAQREVLSNAAGQIRDRILDNPVFKQYA